MLPTEGPGAKAPSPRFRRTPPKLCTHKRSGNAFVWHDGRQHWFGPAADPATRTRYEQFLLQVLTTGGGAEVLREVRGGFPWRGDARIEPLQLREVPAGRGVRVNGRDLRPRH